MSKTFACQPSVMNFRPPDTGLNTNEVYLTALSQKILCIQSVEYSIMQYSSPKWILKQQAIEY